MSPENILAFATAIVVLTTAVVGYLSLDKKVSEIHVLVNDKMDAALDRIDQLTGLLASSDIAVPERRERGELDDGHE